MKIHATDAEVLERIRQGMPLRKIAEMMHIGEGTMSSITGRLRELGAIHRDGFKGYQVLIDTYEIVEDNIRRTINAPTVIVTPEQAAYIRENYGKVPRTQIARGLGVDKVTVNNMILQLRLGG